MTKNRKGPAIFILAAACMLHSLIILSQPGEHAVSSGRKVPVIELSGNGYQRGLQHGGILKNEIGEVFKLWKTNIQRSTGQNADTVIGRFLKATNFTPAIQKWTPEIYDELKGISESSGQSFKDVLCFQLVDEFWVYLDRLENTSEHHCSGMGVAMTDSHPAYIAQNMDLESYMNGFQILLHIAAGKDGPEQYILSCAGLIALNGVNSNSIGVCVNTLMELEASADGLPVACMIRGILLQKNRADALRFVQTVKHASGQNYIIGAVDSVYDYEASAGKVTRFVPVSTEHAIVYHTNHAIANDDVKPWYKEFHRQILAGELKNDNSVIRFTCLKNRLGHAPADLSESIIKESLRSKDDLQNPVCRTFKKGNTVFTFSSVLMTLGKNPSIQLTCASPDSSEYILHAFTHK